MRRRTCVLSFMIFVSLLVTSLFGGCGCPDEGASGNPAEIEVDPGSLIFEAIAVGQKRVLSTIITNVGHDTLFIEEIDIKHSSTSKAFSLLAKPKDYPIKLGPQESITLKVQYAPKRAGSAQGKIVIISNAKNANAEGEVKVTLSSASVEADLSATPDPLDFGAIPPKQKKIKELTVKNSGKASVVIKGTLFGPNPDKQFRVEKEPKYPKTLKPGDSMKMKLSYSPVAPAAQTFLYFKNDRAMNFKVELIGKIAAPKIKVTPKLVKFSKVLLGTKGTKTFIIENIGGIDLIVNSIDLEKGGSSDFNLPKLPSLPMTLASGKKKEITVEYFSQDVKNDKGIVKITSNDLGEPTVKVLLEALARGCDMKAIPSSLTFTGKSIKTVKVLNRGNRPCKYNKASFEKGMSPEFTLLTPLPASKDLAPGQTLSFKVQFIPKDAKPDKGALIIETADPDTPKLKIPVDSRLGSSQECDLKISPSVMQFGFVAAGRSRRLPLNLHNNGYGTCTFQQVNIAPNPQSAFALIKPLQGKTLAAGMRMTVEVSLTPRSASTYQGQLNLRSNDSKTPVAKIQLVASSGKVCIEALPDPLDFGSVKAGCSTPKETLEVFNICSRSLTVTGLKFSSSTNKPNREFIFIQAPIMPKTLKYGQSFSLQMVYAPKNLGQDLGSLEVSNSVKGQSPIVISLLGKGVNTDEQTDTFQQTDKPKIDILFVVDDSCSMRSYQQNLASNFKVFIKWASQLKVDFQIGITTTDVTGKRAGAGCLRGSVKILKPTTPSLESQFQRNVNVGTQGSYDERGLQAAYKALTAPAITGCNKGFYRKPASLSIVFISDEPDFSKQSVNFYVNFYKNLKGFRRSAQLRASAIALKSKAQCQRGGGGCRYYTVAKLLRGIYEGIKSNTWGQTLNQLGAITFGYQSQFFLTRPAIPSTIKVSVDGRSVPQNSSTGWTYDGSSNSINFSKNAIPKSRSTIKITYRSVCLPPP